MFSKISFNSFKYSFPILYEALLLKIYIDSLDKDYYTDGNRVSEVDNILMLVNKYHYLSSNYIPLDLEEIDSKEPEYAESRRLINMLKYPGGYNIHRDIR